MTATSFAAFRSLASMPIHDEPSESLQSAGVRFDRIARDAIDDHIVRASEGDLHAGAIVCAATTLRSIATLLCVLRADPSGGNRRIAEKQAEELRGLVRRYEEAV